MTNKNKMRYILFIMFFFNKRNQESKKKKFLTKNSISYCKYIIL